MVMVGKLHTIKVSSLLFSLLFILFFSVRSVFFLLVFSEQRYGLMGRG
jgi:hypothetical protein